MIDFRLNINRRIVPDLAIVGDKEDLLHAQLHDVGTMLSHLCSRTQSHYRYVKWRRIGFQDLSKRYPRIEQLLPCLETLEKG